MKSWTRRIWSIIKPGSHVKFVFVSSSEFNTVSAVMQISRMGPEPFGLVVMFSNGMDFYHPRMWIGNNFSRVSVCVCVCVCVCLSVSLSICLWVCVPVQAVTFELLKVESSFLGHTYISAIFRSSLNTKVIGSRSRSNQ